MTWALLAGLFAALFFVFLVVAVERRRKSIQRRNIEAQCDALRAAVVRSGTLDMSI